MFKRQPNSDPVEQANYRHFVMDIAWFGLALAATTRFLQIYAIRIMTYSDVSGWMLSQMMGDFEGGSAGQITDVLAYMTSLPAIVMMFATSMSGWWRRRFKDSLGAIWLPSLAFRFVFLLPTFAPLFPPELRPLWLVLAVTLPALPQGVAGAIFLVMMRESIASERLSTLLSQRALALNIGIGISVVIFGLLLQALPYPTNYQLMFVLAFVFTLISVWHVWKVQILHPAPAPQPHRPTLRFWLAPGFAAAIFVLLGTHITFFSVYPITPAHLVNNLHADEAFMTVFAMVELIAGAAIASRTNQIADRIGYASLIALSMVGTGISAFIFALTPTLTLTLLGAAISGAAWTAVGIGVFGYFIEHTPTEHVTHYSMAYMQIIGLGTFIGPMVGKWLINDGATVVTVMLIGAALRLICGVLVQYNPLETSKAPQTALPMHSGTQPSMSASRSA